MPISSVQYLVGTTAVEICTPDRQGIKVWVHNDDRSAGHDVFVGGNGVTITTGMRLSAGETIMLALDPGDGLSAVSNQAGGHPVHVLVQKQD